MTSWPKTDMSVTNRPHFFKIILDDNIHDKKLSIPRKFVRKYGKDLSNPVLLKVPDGRTWQMELIKSDGEVWLQNGWQEFLEYYSLAHGSFLVFEYNKRDCHFNVIIFDKTASEIDYHVNVTNGEIKEPKMIEETETDASVEISDHLMLSRKRKGKSPLPFSQPQKKVKLETPTENTSLHCCGNPVQGNKNPLAHEQSNHPAAIETSKNFTSLNPFFKLIISSGHLTRPIVHVPRNFISNIKKSTKKAKLQVENRWWIVKLTIYPHHNKGQFLSGWSVFVRENSLRKGDVCIFELIDRETALVKVTIFRNAK
ncbi:B3 domain-containing transcription factor VRN1-like [Manihot esculenta]|uniref:Uncharacterized protein n=1 Tax=Manihot esculenta TaxID=3983 RepID=A0ACB7HF77_MANES|nr:B3 domain-containing transcription factor VRN1-like [Manihot esculenta]KAG8651328.1 hypothetical protein MANES_07G115100v8 [Manihot esculenta]